MAAAFGTTWWGRAWLDALEGIAGGRGGRLARGRRWARQHRAEDLHIEPGAVWATVATDRGEPGDAHVAVRVFRDDEWDTVLDAIAAKAGHAAALLDGELDPGVVADADAVEVDLLPRARDLRTTCTCPDEAEPCEHAAAVCYLLADALDADPFVLLLLRGRRRDEVLDGVRHRRTGASRPGETPGTAPAGTPGGPAATGTEEATGGIAGGIDLATEGVAAVDVWSRAPGPLPAVPLPPHTPGRPAPWPSEPPPHAPFDGDGLRMLASDAARRAWELCVGGVVTGLELDERTDLARRAVGAPPELQERLADHAGLAVVDLDVVATAWDLGGAAGVRANDEPRWNPPPLEMARARDLVVDAGMTARRVHLSGNRITAEGRLQLRRSRDGRWYAFTKETGRWSMAAPPEDDIDDLLDRDFSS